MITLAALITRVRSSSTRVSVLRAQLAEWDLSRMDLERVDLRGCVFDRANLERAIWRRMRVHDCSFVGTSLVDVVLDEMVFVDCDLRGADLSVDKRGGFATMRRSRFERCDLRATNWRGRDLATVALTDCKLYGAFGGPSTEGLTIVRPDFDVGELGRAANRETNR